MKDHIKAVAALFRSQTQSAPGDSLKTTSLFFVCADLIVNGAASATALYREIVLLRFDEYGFSVNLAYHNIDRLLREELYMSEAVVTLQKLASSAANNLAKCVRGPRRACIQCGCCNAANLGGCSLRSAPSWGDFDLGPYPGKLGI